jgi:hypothetical protein
MSVGTSSAYTGAIPSREEGDSVREEDKNRAVSNGTANSR